MKRLTKKAFEEKKRGGTQPRKKDKVGNSGRQKVDEE